MPPLSCSLQNKREVIEGAKALGEVEEALQKVVLTRWQEDKDLNLCVLLTLTQPTAVLWQDRPLLWVHPHCSPAQSIEHYPTAVAVLASLVIKQSTQHFGKQPEILVVPYTSQQISVLCATIDECAILHCSFSGNIDNHFPRHPLIRFYKEHPVIFPKVTVATPIPGATNIYTDGSKTGMGAYMIEGKEPCLVQFTPGSPQVVELSIVVEVFKTCHFPFNLISDSSYVVNAMRVLETSGAFALSSTVCHLFQKLQQLIWSHSAPFHILHIRAHTNLPGPIATGNDVVDRGTHMPCVFLAASLEQAAKFHSLYHVPAHVLQHEPLSS